MAEHTQTQTHVNDLCASLASAIFFLLPTACTHARLFPLAFFPPFPLSQSDVLSAHAAMAKVGMPSLELRHTADGTGELRKTRTGLTLTLSGIGPGYAVDRLGERLSQLGSAGHLVVLGGEARAWGTRTDGRPWELSIMRSLNDSTEGFSSSLTLAAGEAVAFSTIRPGRSPIDPRTGQPVDHDMATVMARGPTCAIADALAVAAAIAMPKSPAH